MDNEKTDYNYSYDERFNPAFWTIRQNREEPEQNESGESPAESEENNQ